MNDPIYKEESYQIIGLCMEVHRELGRGHNEVIDKDALEFEFERSQVPFAREKEFLVHYKTIVLPHKYFADFVVFHSTGSKGSREAERRPCQKVLNYLAASRLKLGLLVNFGEDSLNYKRVVL